MTTHRTLSPPARRHTKAVLAVVLAVTGFVLLGVPVAAAAHHARHHARHHLRHRLAPHAAMTLSQAPAGLRAAVRRTLGRGGLRLNPSFQSAKLTASDGATGDKLGYSVAISGSTAIVGAPSKSAGAGTAYVFVHAGTTWAQQGELTPASPAAGDEFGYSVAISGSTAVIGAPDKISNTGARTGVAYVFVHSASGWTQQAELSADVSAGAQFGASVAVFGSTALVGAPLANAAFVFAGSGGTWGQQAVLIPSTGGGEFGHSVSLSGSTAVIGAPLLNSNTGAAWVFTSSGTPTPKWSQQAELTASDGATGDQFGTSVAASGSTAVVGAPDRSSDTGAAYVFARWGTVWSEKAELTASDGASGDLFGTSVSASGTAATVGAPGNTSSTGGTYVFTLSGGSWSQFNKLTASDGAAGDLFGQSVGISGGSVIVGAPDNNSQTGAAYVFGPPLQQAELSEGGEGGLSVALSGSTAIVGAPKENSGAGVAYVYVNSGTAWTQQAKLTAADGVAGDFFGFSVALDGSTAVVGALYHNSSTGAAYVFVRSGSTWFQQGELTASDGAAGDHFGNSVAVSGSTAVVGAASRNTRAGAAYVFVLSGTLWSQQAELTASDAHLGDSFGASVAISGSTVVVGAPEKNGRTGAAYVFVQSGASWPQTAKLPASDAALNDLFGNSVAISGSNVIVGAPGKNSNTGAAYVFVGSGSSWSPQAKLTASDGAPGDEFGYSVAIYGTSSPLAIIGASRRSSFTGAAYVFVFSPNSPNLWSQQAELTASDRADGDAFGSSVAIYGSTALVGAPGSDSNTGAAYVFAQSGTTWSQQQKLSADSLFGASVAINGTTAVVGAPYSDSNTGSAYVFISSGGTWKLQTQLSASDAAPGAFFGGTVAVSGSTVLVGASNAASQHGAVYVFVQSGSTWSQQAILTAPDGAPLDSFGNSVAISGSTAVVGAPGKGSFAGAAYVFLQSGTTWSEQAELTDGSTGGAFGISVAISGSTAVIGANEASSNRGAAYVFVGSGATWSQQAKLVASDGVAGDEFGLSVAINGATAMIGAPDKSSNTGAAYVFVRAGTTWSQKAELTASDAAAGDEFGDSVAISGTTAIVGAPFKNSNTGAAYMFVNSGSWSQSAKLLGSDTAPGDAFGSSAALFGSTAIIGAPNHSLNVGSAYVFANA